MFKVRIPSPLRSYTQGADVIETDGANVGAVLGNLKEKAAGIETRLFKAPNQLNRFVNVYLNDEDIRFLQEPRLDPRQSRRREISIVPGHRRWTLRVHELTVPPAPPTPNAVGSPSRPEPRSSSPSSGR